MPASGLILRDQELVGFARHYRGHSQARAAAAMVHGIGAVISAGKISVRSCRRTACLVCQFCIALSEYDRHMMRYGQQDLERIGDAAVIAVRIDTVGSTILAGRDPHA